MSWTVIQNELEHIIQVNVFLLAQAGQINMIYLY